MPVVGPEAVSDCLVSDNYLKNIKNKENKTSSNNYMTLRVEEKSHNKYTEFELNVCYSKSQGSIRNVLCYFNLLEKSSKTS